MLNHVLDFLFPPACVVCGKINKDWLCENCKKRIKRLEKFCIIDEKDKKFERLLYIFKYESLIRKLMLQYKFSGKAYIYNFFANVIIGNEENTELLKKYDMIIPIPMHIKKQKKRGYNQTELIGEKISEKLNIPCYSNLFKKIVNTKTQSKLNGKARQKNIKNAFFLENELIVENKNIILFDDIFTTGATVNECSRILKNAGAKEILVMVLAKD